MVAVTSLMHTCTPSACTSTWLCSAVETSLLDNCGSPNLSWQSDSQVLVSLATSMGAFFLQVLGHTSGLSLTSKLPFWSSVRWPLQPQQGNGLPMLDTVEGAYTLDLGGYYLPGHHLNHSCRAWLHSRLRLSFFTLHKMFVQEPWPCMYIVT